MRIVREKDLYLQKRKKHSIVQRAIGNKAYRAILFMRRNIKALVPGNGWLLVSSWEGSSFLKCFYKLWGAETGLLSGWCGADPLLRCMQHLWMVLVCDVQHRWVPLAGRFVSVRGKK